MAITTRAAAREALIEIEMLAEKVRAWAEEERPKLKGNALGRVIALESEAQTLRGTAMWCQDVIEADMDEHDDA